MSIDRARVLHLARLARLELPAGEGTLLDEATLDRLVAELGAILDHVREIEALDLSQVPPTSHGVPLPPSFREDQAAPTLPTDRALAAAPERADGCFVVPKVVE